jgi:pilus assembly protein Flp/PilA
VPLQTAEQSVNGRSDGPGRSPGKADVRRPPATTQLARGPEDTMVAAMKRFWSDESGATAVEYGLMVALIAVVIITAVALLGTNLSNKFNSVAASVGNAGS